MTDIVTAAAMVLVGLGGAVTGWLIGRGGRQAEIDMLLADSQTHYAELRAELDDLYANRQRVLADARPKDELHCSCCPELRLEIARLNQIIADMEVGRGVS